MYIFIYKVSIVLNWNPKLTVYMCKNHKNSKTKWNPKEGIQNKNCLSKIFLYRKSPKILAFRWYLSLFYTNLYNFIKVETRPRDVYVNLFPVKIHLTVFIQLILVNHNSIFIHETTYTVNTGLQVIMLLLSFSFVFQTQS